MTRLAALYGVEVPSCACGEFDCEACIENAAPARPEPTP